VLVLDEAAQELATLVGYLESVTEQLMIDLIAVSAYEVGGSRVLIPQRVDAERPTSEPAPPKAPPAGPEGRYVEGAEDFADAIESAGEEHRPMLRRLCEWAISLDREGLVRSDTYHAKGGDMMSLPNFPEWYRDPRVAKTLTKGPFDTYGKSELPRKRHRRSSV
jgi:hypothetical protein